MAKQKYSIVFAPAALRQLRKLPTRDQKRFVREIETLADDPRPPGVKKLIGADNLWRIRIGDYRVAHKAQATGEIKNAKLLVFVLRIAHRKDIYREGK